MHYSTLIAIDVPHVEENEAENLKIKESIASMKANKPEGKDYLYHLILEKLEESQTTFARTVSDLAYEFMEPFGQNSEKYQEFCDITEELKDIYMNGEGNFIKTPDGKIMEEYRSIGNHRFTIMDGQVYERIGKRWDDSSLIRTKLSKKMKALMGYPFKKAYKTFELFATEGRGETYYEEEGGYGYYYNPNTCYDWCAIGGRWPNVFLVKEACQEVYLSAGNNGRSKECPEGYKWVTAARMKNIEWELMKEIDKEYETKNYHAFVEYFEKKEVPPNGYYVLSDNGIKTFGEMAYIKGETLDDFLLRKGISDELKYPCICYGYFHDGVYNERWIYSTPEQPGCNKNLIAWQKEVDVYLDGLTPEEVLVSMDIHI